MHLLTLFAITYETINWLGGCIHEYLFNGEILCLSKFQEQIDLTLHDIYFCGTSSAKSLIALKMFASIKIL